MNHLLLIASLVLKNTKKVYSAPQFVHELEYNQLAMFPEAHRQVTGYCQEQNISNFVKLPNGTIQTS